MTVLSRRSMLRGLGVASLGAALPSIGRARQGGAPCKLIMVSALGGWDISYALDPKPGLPTVDSPLGTLETFEDIPVLVDPSRPGVTAFFEQWAPRTAIVNGIDMRSIAHVSCTQRVFTGSPDPTRPDFGAVVGHQLGTGMPVPYLVLGDVAFPGPLGVSMARVGFVNQMSLLAHDDVALPTTPQFDHAPLLPTAGDQQLVEQFLQARAERARAVRGATGYNAARVDDFVDALDRSAVVRANADSLGEFGLTASMEEQIDFAVRSLDEGLSWAVGLASRTNMDTHYGNELQGFYQDQLFTELAVLADRLETTPGSSSGSSLLDETLVIVFSEMSRTPRLNSLGGKDHWPVTSAMLFGGPVSGGRAYGASNELVEAEAVDFATGEASAAGQVIEPQHLLAGLIDAVGADASAYFDGVTPFAAPFA